jgi:hypothetical protein
VATLLVGMLYGLIGMYQYVHERNERIAQNKEQIHRLEDQSKSTKRVISVMKEQDRKITKEVNERKLEDCQTFNKKAKQAIATEFLKDVETMNFFFPSPRTKSQSNFVSSYISLNVNAVSKANPSNDCSPKALGLTLLPNNEVGPSNNVTSPNTSPKVLRAGPTTTLPLLIQPVSQRAQTPSTLEQQLRQHRRCVYTHLDKNVDPTESRLLICY